MGDGANAVVQEMARVLVVDDSTVIRQAIKKMLKADFEVVMAEDGEAGWEQLLSDGGIRLLITDIEMPRLDGYGFICRARAAEEPRIRDLPIIAITGAEDEQTKVRAYACGATDFITKPLDRTQLHARVQAYVQADDTDAGLAEPVTTQEEEVALDPLTQLHGRRYFQQRSEQALDFARRHGQDLSLARIDIDDFKALYKQYGDEAVDQILVHLAKLLSAEARAEDTVARIGGAEFALLVPSTGRAEALAVCERLRSRVAAEPVQNGKHDIRVSVSMGLVSLTEDRRDSMAELLRLAEQRLSHAKSEGGNRVSVSVFGEAILEPEEVTLSAPVEIEESDPGAFSVQPAGSETRLPVDLVSIDKALQLLARGEGARLAPYLPALALQVLPLLEQVAVKMAPAERACIGKLKALLSRMPGGGR